jgi:hypothetical protein
LASSQANGLVHAVATLKRPEGRAPGALSKCARVDFRRRKKRAPLGGFDYSRRTKFWQEPGAWAKRASRNSNRKTKTQLLWQKKLDSLE